MKKIVLVILMMFLFSTQAYSSDYVVGKSTLCNEVYEIEKYKIDNYYNNLLKIWNMLLTSLTDNEEKLNLLKRLHDLDLLDLEKEYNMLLVNMEEEWEKRKKTLINEDICLKTKLDELETYNPPLFKTIK